MQPTQPVEDYWKSEPTGSSQEEPSANILTLVTDWFAALRSRFEITTELAVAEAKLAATSVAIMLILAVATAVFLLFAWGLVLAGIVYGLLQAGIPVFATLAGLVVLHLLGAVLMARKVFSLSENLRFVETRQAVSRPRFDDTEVN